MGQFFGLENLCQPGVFGQGALLQPPMSKGNATELGGLPAAHQHGFGDGAVRFAQPHAAKDLAISWGSSEAPSPPSASSSARIAFATGSSFSSSLKRLLLVLKAFADCHEKCQERGIGTEGVEAKPYDFLSALDRPPLEGS